MPHQMTRASAVPGKTYGNAKIAFPLKC